MIRVHDKARKSHSIRGESSTKQSRLYNIFWQGKHC